jgi:IS5 family transposase
MRNNKINNIDLFTNHANEIFKQHIKTQSKQALEVIKNSIDWESLLKPIESILIQERSSAPTGRKPFSLLVIVRCFLLQSIYGLSDPRLEEEIADRRSFQIFLELNSGDSIPDETTICRYRTLFAKHNLDKVLFDSFNKQLIRKDMILEKVTLVDATIKQAQAKPGKKREQEATFTKKRGKTYYGYKGHIGLDHGTGVIRSVEFTPANVHDSDKFEQLISGNESSVYADKGYASKKRKESLESKGIFCGILEKGYRSHPLTRCQIAINKQLSRIRNNVERPFSYMTRVLGYDRCSYYGLARNRFEFNLKATIYNIRRFLTLSACIS